MGLVADCPDLTVEAIRGALRARGIDAGHGSVWRFFVRHGISFKKNRARQRTGSPQRRRRTPTVAGTTGRV